MDVTLDSFVLMLNKRHWAMYLRGVQCARDTLSHKATPRNFARSRAVRFSGTTRQFEHGKVHDHRIETSSRSETGKDGSQHGPGRRSVPPLAVFVLSIPLGYGLNYALKKRDEDAASSADGFIKYKLASKEDISSTCSIFTLKPAASSVIRTCDPSYKRVVTSMQFKQPQLQIARNYTLLPPQEAQDPQELSFLIRRERNGEVSGYLHKLEVGSAIELRGLSAEYVLPETVDTVVFLAGGTGIAPAMQVADALAGKARVHILWANRRRDDCIGGISDTKETSGSWNSPDWWKLFTFSSSRGSEEYVVKKSSQEQSAIVAQLDRLKRAASSGASVSGAYSTTLSVDYYVDEEGKFISPKHVQQLVQENGSAAPGSDHKGKNLLLVSGPEGFVNYWAASKQWINGREVQGPLGGILSTLELGGWEVVKL